MVDTNASMSCRETPKNSGECGGWFFVVQTLFFLVQTLGGVRGVTDSEYGFPG